MISEEGSDLFFDGSDGGCGGSAGFGNSGHGWLFFWILGELRWFGCLIDVFCFGFFLEELVGVVK